MIENENILDKEETKPENNIKKGINNFIEFRNKVIVPICIAIVIVVCIGNALSSSSSKGGDTNNVYIQKVKTGHMNAYSEDITIGDAFDNFFGNGKWTQFKDSSNNNIVEFNGDATLKGKSVKIKIQWQVYDKSSKCVYSSANDIEMYQADREAMLTNVFNVKSGKRVAK